MKSVISEEKTVKNQLSASMLNAMASSIRNPIQAISGLVENSVQGFVYDIAEKGILQGRPLEIDISLHTQGPDHQSYLTVTDNGPGISPSCFKDIITGCFKPQHIQRTRDDLSDYDCAEHGLGIKLSALRLAETCLILSKYRAKNQIGVQYLSVGMLS